MTNIELYNKIVELLREYDRMTFYPTPHYSNDEYYMRRADFRDEVLHYMQIGKDSIKILENKISAFKKEEDEKHKLELKKEEETKEKRKNCKHLFKKNGVSTLMSGKKMQSFYCTECGQWKEEEIKSFINKIFD